MYDPERYKKVVKVCALERDFEILSHGDKTLVGERGVSLSGGQKARVSLARVTYRTDLDIVLFDDPLSAVDPSVADHLFTECICNFLNDKIRILVTHQLQFLQQADSIIALKEGEVSSLGTFDELQAKETDFATFLKRDNNDDVEDEADEDKISERKDLTAPLIEPDAQEKQTEPSLVKNKKPSNDEDAEAPLLDKDELEIKIIDSKTKVDKQPEDVTAKDKIKGLRLYYEYFKSGAHVLYIVALLILIIGNHILLIFSDWWIATWATKEEQYRKDRSAYVESLNNSVVNVSVSTNVTPTFQENLIPPSFNKHYYVIRYAFLTVGFLVTLYIRTAMHFYLCVTSNSKLHAGMLAAILKAKIRFFDTNPVGRVLNRFSKDMGQVDELLPLTFMDVFFLGGAILAILVFVVSINYFVLIIIVPLAVYFVWVRRYFLKPSREIKRMEGSNRSPVFGHLSSSLNGLVTIRAFCMQSRFVEKYHRLQDLHGAAWFLFVAGTRWFAFRLDLLTALFVSAVAYFSVILISFLSDSSPLNASNLGLILTYSITLVGAFQWTVRQSAEVENLMTSVERIREYHNVPPEAKDDENKRKPPPNWPDKGAITFEDVSYSHYKGGPVVLHNLDLSFKAKEKIGIVGRTGAGKSSFSATLFRMCDQITGCITIDEVDTSQITLEDLRRSLAIIPQDPVLFSGTMRKNLDAYSDFTDVEIWSALEQVQLKSVVENLPMKLETELAESGSNFSVGQRQLVCLARAILRNNRILVIDEATANVDMRTDRLIQETIRKEFSHCTVFTIAHRLNTIIDSDRILVLDAGRVMEFDEPHTLLQIGMGTFNDMIRMTGAHEAELRQAAERAYYEKRKSAE